MVNYCQNEGVNSFFVVEAEMDSVNSYEIDMLYNNFVEGIIQPEFRSIDGRMLLYNKINGMKSLKDYMQVNSLTAKQTLSVMGAACNAVVEAEEYMLDPDNLMLKPEYIFCSVGLEECRFVYAPGTHMNVKKQIRHLSEGIVRRIDHSDGKLVDFMYGVYETVVMDNFDMEKLREDVCEMQKQVLCREKKAAFGKHGEVGGNSDEYGELKDMLFGDDAAPMNSVVLAGESGTGRENLFLRRKTFECKNLSNLRNRWLLILFVITIAAGLGLVVFQSAVYGHIADVRLLMLVVAVAAIELFLYLEFRRKDDVAVPRSARVPAGAPAGIADGVSDEAVGMPGEPAVMSGEPSGLKMLRRQTWNPDVVEDGSYISGRQNTEKYVHRTADQNPMNPPVNLSEGTQILREPGVTDDDTTLLAADVHEENSIAHISVELTGRQNGEKLEIHMTKGEQTVGRDGSADVVINDRSISRRHAVIGEKNGRIYVKDLSSTNGTYVNEICMCKDRYWPLSGGDVLRIGGVEYTVQILLI